jgi:hypothetical protein
LLTRSAKKVDWKYLEFGVGKQDPTGETDRPSVVCAVL